MTTETPTSKPIIVDHFAAEPPTKRGIATITKITKGRFTGQFKYQLCGDNGEPLTGPSEQMTRKHNVLKALSRYFPNFTIKDLTIKPKK